MKVVDETFQLGARTFW